VGKSGAGKTNLIKVLAGLEEIESGEIFVGDREVSFYRARDRGISLLSGATPLFNRKSIDFNLRYPLKKRGADKNEIENRVRDIAVEFELGELGRKVIELTEEEQIRVLIARAFIRNIKLLLVDEPMDFIHNVDYFYELVKKTLAKHDVCAVFCSYDIDPLVDICEKFVVLDEGKILFCGSYDELKNSDNDFAKAICFMF